ncbi:hypothetical protein [Ottowia sp. VDI28]|uniref:hypothetical protein n=1 Tax=Ottowia sp. VDI28 TaxID=3133968 RepID=UPI003C2BA480
MATMIEEMQRQQRINQIPADGYPKAPAADGSQNNPLNTEFGRNATNALSALPGAASIPGAMGRVASAAGSALGASAPAATLVGRLAQTAAPYAPVAGGAAALMSASSPASSSPASPPAVAGAANPTDQRLAGGTQTTPGVGASAALNQVMPGVYQHGRGQYSDNPAGMGMSPNLGHPSAANIDRADSLISRMNSSAPASPTPSGGNSLVQAAGLIPEGTMAVLGGDGYGLRDPNYLAERNALVSAGSLRAANERAGTPGRRGGQPGVSEADKRLDNFYKDRQDAAKNANNLAVQGMRSDSDLAQAGMREQGLDRRSLVQAMLEQQKVDQAGEAQGYSNRAAGQLEQLRATLLDPNATPQQRQQAQQALMAIQGKTPESPWKLQFSPATKNLDGSTTQPIALRSNSITGQVEQVPLGQGAGKVLLLAPSNAATVSKVAIPQARRVGKRSNANALGTAAKGRLRHTASDKPLKLAEPPECSACPASCRLRRLPQTLARTFPGLNPGPLRQDLQGSPTGTPHGLRWPPRRSLPLEPCPVHTWRSWLTRPGRRRGGRGRRGA